MANDSHGSVGELVNQFCQQHADALLSLGYALFDDREEAQAVVVRCLAEACTSPLEPVAISQRELRRRMAERVYARWTLRSQVSRSARTTHPEHFEKVVLSLCLLGGHSYRQAAELVGVPPIAVAEAIRSASHPRPAFEGGDRA